MFLNQETGIYILIVMLLTAKKPDFVGQKKSMW